METLQLFFIGRNPIPTMYIPPILSLGCCLIGHSWAGVLPIHSAKAAAKIKLACHYQNTQITSASNSLEATYESHNFLSTPPFLVYPKTFEVGPNESSNLIVLFRPISTGKFSMILAILEETGQQWHVLIEGCGTDIQLEFESKDGHPISPAELDQGMWFGNTPVLTSTAVRELTVENSTLVPLRFFWNVETHVSYLEGNKCHGKEDVGRVEMAVEPVYTINPSFGTFDVGSLKSFLVTFAPFEARPYRQRASLYVDTRRSFALCSNFWEDFKIGLKHVCQEVPLEHFGIHGNNGKVEMYQVLSSEIKFEGADNNGGVIKMFEIDLVGAGLPFDIQIIPPSLRFSSMMVQHNTYTKVIQLRNNTQAEVFFHWDVSSLPWATCKDFNSITVHPLNGTVKGMDTNEIRVVVRAVQIGNLCETLCCRLDGPRQPLLLPLSVEGFVQGPNIEIGENFMDFGSVQVGKTVSLPLTLRNKNNIEASFWLVAVPHFCSKLKSTALEYKDSDPEISFNPQNGWVPHKSSLEVRVDLLAKTPGQKDLAILCQVSNGLSPSKYALLRAIVEAPTVYISPSKIDLGITFLGSRLKRKIAMHNTTGLVINFRWLMDDIGDMSAMNVNISPQQGQLEPHGVLEVMFSLVLKGLGEKEYVSVCEIEGSNCPIGVLFRSYISGTRCSYHVTEPMKENNNKFESKQEGIVVGNVFKSGPNVDPERIDNSSLPLLDYGKRCRLGSVQWLRLTIQNHTSVGGKVSVVLNKYSIPPQRLSREEITVLSSMTKRPYFAYKRTKIHPLMASPDEIHQKYWSNSGHRMVSRRLEIAMQEKLNIRNEGICFLIYPDCVGTLDPWGQCCLDIFCLSCFPGVYTDVLTCVVGSCPPADIGVTIGVVGTPLFARSNQLEPRGFQHDTRNSYVSLKWNPVAAGYPTRIKTFWVANVAPYPLEVQWDIMKYSKDACGHVLGIELELEDESLVRVNIIGDADKGPASIHLVLEEKVRVIVKVKQIFARIVDDSPFEVVSPVQVVQGQSSIAVMVTCYSEKASKFNYILLGKTRLNGTSKMSSTVNSGRPFKSFEQSRGSLKITDESREDAPNSSLSSQVKEVTAALTIVQPSKASSGQEASQNVRNMSKDSQGSQGGRLSLNKSVSELTSKPAGSFPNKQKKSSLKNASFSSNKEMPPDKELEPSNVSTDFNDPSSKDLSQPPTPDVVSYSMQEEEISSLHISLEALVFEPSLKVANGDKVYFRCLNTTVLDMSSFNKIVKLKNDYPYALSFSVSTFEPFYITGAYLLEGNTETSCLKKCNSASNFILSHDETLHLSIAFSPDEETLFALQDAVFEKSLLIDFNYHCQQAILLHAELFFPAVTVFSENIWFGTVVIKGVQTLQFSVVNASYVDVQWTLVKEPLQEEIPIILEDEGSKKKGGKKNSISAIQKPSIEKRATKGSIAAELAIAKELATIQEVETLKDPFKLSLANGFLPSQDSETPMKQVVTVEFIPPEPMIYKQKILIQVKNGRGCSLVLEGQGVLEKPQEPIVDLKKESTKPVAEKSKKPNKKNAP